MGTMTMGWTDNIQNIVLGIFLLVVMGVSENTGRMAEARRKASVRKEAMTTAAS